jgi:radical S-adenosyl methionine domain-containing protein 2
MNIQYTNEERNEDEVLAVNWHLEPACNYACDFCYAPLIEQRKLPRLDEAPGVTLIRSIAMSGAEKINFVGGEPMLHPHIGPWIAAAKHVGMTTSIVSNGTRMTEDWLRRMRPYLDWLGLSIDASNDEMHALLGRCLKGEKRAGKSEHLKRCLRVWRTAQALGYGLKLNTVVTSVNADDDMSGLVAKLKPHRWKIFRVLHIEGENDGRVDPLLITGDQFERYVRRHRIALEHLGKIEIVAEDNEDMLGTYAMVDPQGMVYTNQNGRYTYSAESATEVGFSAAWTQVRAGFSQQRFEKRGGEWNWSEDPGTSLRLPLSEEVES